MDGDLPGGVPGPNTIRSLAGVEVSYVEVGRRVGPSYCNKNVEFCRDGNATPPARSGLHRVAPVLFHSVHCSHTFSVSNPEHLPSGPPWLPLQSSGCLHIWAFKG